MLQLKRRVAPGFTTSVGGSTDKSGGGIEGKTVGASSAKQKKESHIFF